MTDTTKQYMADSGRMPQPEYMADEGRTSGRVYLEPFNPERHKPVDLGDGEYMTERTRTVTDSAGNWSVVPSVWFNDTGRPVDLQAASDDQLSQLAERYEQTTGNRFPRFRSMADANQFAEVRSASGGASSLPLYMHDGGR